jgi:uncharacterized protein
MSVKEIGRIETVWRYPVKSMAGEKLAGAFAGFGGVYGDRIYAFVKSKGRKDFPYLTARDRASLLCFAPSFRNADEHTRLVDVRTPEGESLAIDDPRLLAILGEGLRDEQTVSLLRSDRALADCHPISLIANNFIEDLGKSLGMEMDPRRFRANFYVDLGPQQDLESLIGMRIQLGRKAVVSLIERDPRCMMISLDPDGQKATPQVLKHVVQNNAGTAGVYAEVLVEGNVFPGDAAILLD